ncbi:MAG: hypothetical protein JSV16_04385 [Candidatus Hydrogenedentota bacterium]|nr:MAG: hypothetical protein JSV16_04385 [Candidatus Hydrogenedentota bacterium]
MHQIEFDAKERADGSIEVRFTWTHDVGLPTESVIKNQYRHYTCKRDIAREVTYFLNVEENYGEQADEELTNALCEMPTHALKLLSYMVIDLWGETQVEYKRRKISNRRRFAELSRSVHKAFQAFSKKKPNLTYGEALAVLEKQYSLIRSGAKAGASLSETLNKLPSRSRAGKRSK